MDKIDVGIIRCLTQDARMNASQIGARVNLSVSAVIERMKKLEASGLIRNYTAVIDERLAGYDTQALISVRLEHPKYNESFTQQMHAISAVMECFYITGDFGPGVRQLHGRADPCSEPYQRDPRCVPHPYLCGAGEHQARHHRVPQNQINIIFRR